MLDYARLGILVSKGFSILQVTANYENLDLSLAPYEGRSDIGRDSSYLRMCQFVSLGQSSAVHLYYIATSILSGHEHRIEYIYPCQPSYLKFEFIRCEKDHMVACLSMSKKNQTIKFWFPTRQYTVVENGERIAKTFQAGLYAFAKVLRKYLESSGVDPKARLADGELESYDFPGLKIFRN